MGKERLEYQSIWTGIESTILATSSFFLPEKGTERCRGFVTLTASVFHPLLSTNASFTGHNGTTAEDTAHIKLFWTLFNKVLQKVKGVLQISTGTRVVFRASMATICNVFGSELSHLIHQDMRVPFHRPRAQESES